MLSGQRILITGGAGSIGSELARQLYKTNTVGIFDSNETGTLNLAEELKIAYRIGDIRDPLAVQSILDEAEPELIFHAAALKHVGPSMSTPKIYIETNVLGTYNLLYYKEDSTKFVNISSDKAVNPDNIMGWTKRGTELLTKIYGGISVRFGNVLGSQGSVIPIWQKQIDQGRAITVTDERMERYFMTIEEACSLVIEAAEKGKSGDIVVLDMGKPVRILDIAKKIIAESRKDIPIEFTGMKPGEKLSEVLMSPHEQENSTTEGRFTYIR